MLPDFNEGQRHANADKPDQKPEALKIANTINELTQAVRFLSDPERLTHLQNPEFDKTQVIYTSANGRKKVALSGLYLHPEFNVSTFPAPFREQERIIQVSYYYRKEDN